MYCSHLKSNGALHIHSEVIFVENHHDKRCLVKHCLVCLMVCLVCLMVCLVYLMLPGAPDGVPGVRDGVHDGLPGVLNGVPGVLECLVCLMASLEMGSWRDREGAGEIETWTDHEPAN